ncbi:conserved hypothetical protein [Roseibium sp. TrichSKD4]|jgi:uncharacterized protein (DUF983 family)|uniref:DUF983 domain-containing protein n=1 Tax=Roseibium sp. TrichSKD4 TaxID=744980 RepID=UPI0001E577F0|nr:DUF983 domain-containing protein [Roseibium sp. TrichSKD4]EFO28933.1 conserved hypothetical protein [Roseibium sp. TrichSKD4]
MCASNSTNQQDNWPAIPPYKTGPRGRCPRCGEGKLFNGFLTMRSSCDNCGLDYSFADPADGPAFFVICFGCVPSFAMAMWIELAYQAPYWVHLFTSLPFLLLTCIPPLRPLKGWMVASEYFYKAGEGKIDNEGKFENVKLDEIP